MLEPDALQGARPVLRGRDYSDIVLLPDHGDARQGRTNPRVVKKTRSKFPSRKPIHSGAGTKRQPLTFFILNTA
ncbi:hypothetical protein [Nostoc sp. CMAA1605]|uniref:hypothetical protein n=1 Tax=Nostoc sp. CMAA1605 TaxID=2055159 RepID=UPI001F3CF5F2|nr:hypothetical protein [Nostoc sp. CMAA1605]